MEEIKELENELKYFEMLNGGLAIAKALRDGTKITLKDVLRNTHFLRNDVEMASKFTPGEFIVFFSSAILCRQFILAVRERKTLVDFKQIEGHPEYQNLINRFFKENEDITRAEANNILVGICNALAHGDIPKLFSYEKFREYKTEIRKSAKNSNIDLLANNLMLGLLEKANAIEFNYTSLFYRDGNGNTIKRPTPKVIKVTINNEDLEKLLKLVVSFSGEKNYEFKFSEAANDISIRLANSEDVGLLLENLTIKTTDYNGTETEMLLDETQKEDLKNISHKYLNSSPLLDPLDFLNICFRKVAVDPLDNITDLFILDMYLPYILASKNSVELEIKLLDMLKKDDYDSTSIDMTLYNFQTDNIYSELLLTILVHLLKQLENKQLYTDVANTNFVKDVCCDIYQEKSENLSQKQLLKFIKTIRNSLIHGRYINNANRTIDFYDEAKGDKSKTEFKFGLDISDLEDLKDECMQTLLDNYKYVLTKNC